MAVKSPASTTAIQSGHSDGFANGSLELGISLALATVLLIVALLGPL